MTRKKSQPTPQQPKRAATAVAVETPASPQQRSVLIIMGVCLAGMFLVSFLFRMQTPGLQVQRPEARQSGKQGQAGMAQSGEMAPESMAAISELMRNMGEKPNDPKILLELGERFMAINSFEKAATFFTRALVSEPGNVETLDHLSMCMYELGRYQEAADFTLQIVALEKDNAQAHLNLGVLHKLLGKVDLAAKHFETVLSLATASDAFKTKAKAQLEELKTHGAAPVQEAPVPPPAAKTPPASGSPNPKK